MSDTDTPTTSTTKTQPRSIIYAIGDIHNNLEALQDALYPLTTNEDAHVVCTGDLIHKGPGENAHVVVSLLQSLVEKGRATVIRGNHDHWTRSGNYGNKEHEGDLTDEQCSWLAQLPLFVRYNGWLFLHGGISGNVRDAIRVMIRDGLLPEKGDWTPDMVKEACYKLRPYHQVWIREIMDTRWLRGSFDLEQVYPGNEGTNDFFWADTYDGEFGFAVFGHTPFDSVARFPHAVGIDLGIGAYEEDILKAEVPLGMVTRGKAIGSIKIDHTRIVRASAYGDGGLPFWGFPCEVFQAGSKYPGVPMDLEEIYEDYMEELHDREDPALMLNLWSELRTRMPDLPPPLLTNHEVEKVKEGLGSCSLGLDLALGRDESPTPNIALFNILNSVYPLEAASVLGLKELKETVENCYMSRVEGLRKVEGLPQLVKRYLTHKKVPEYLKPFWEAVAAE